MATIETKEGGFTDIPGAANSVEIQNLALFAVDQYNQNQNASLEFVKVISAKKQDVAGVIYDITLEAKDGNTNKVYETKVWVTLSNSKQVQEFKEVTTTTVEPISGGISDVPGAANSVEIEDLARFAVDEHNKKENAAVEFVKVISAKQQVVSGTLYYITFEAKDGETKKVYETTVWVKEWLNFREVQEFKEVTTVATGATSATLFSVTV
ncbi:cystatin-1 [Cajanus cajan]|uniref:cystatin-1 n=1 Tax=Cajanus cajan TaxID=3821 RepID=UPI00098D7765|nr:cystatin-1 [Cajanus cajan]